MHGQELNRRKAESGRAERYREWQAQRKRDRRMEAQAQGVVFDEPDDEYMSPREWRERRRQQYYDEQEEGW